MGLLVERRLTEKGCYIGQCHPIQKHIETIDLAWPSIVFSFCVSFILGTISLDAHALSLGAAEVESFIGEPLSVRVPVHDVTDPDSLNIEFMSLQSEISVLDKASIGLDQSSSKLAILVRSDQVINEPYLRFKLNLTEADVEFSKAFTVLLNLRANGSLQNQGGVNTVAVREDVDLDTTFELESDFDRGSNSDNVMGPYDTAQADNIPDKFGAVLDGQSLWRVARRINRAMGVSRSQMMWGLYRANPDAFLSRSVSSLKAGSFLIIPDESFVKSVSDSQAKFELAALESTTNAREVKLLTSNGEKVLETPIVDEAISDATAEIVEIESSEDSSFQVTGIGSPGKFIGVSDSQQSQEIIFSLTETVSNLSQQLLAQDQKIEFLERQVLKLKGFVEVEASVDLELSDQQRVEVSSDLDTEQTSTVESGGVNEGVVGDGINSAVQKTPLWIWALLSIVASIVFIYLMRERLRKLGRSLNLFGANDRVKFEKMVAESAKTDRSKPAEQDSVKKDYSNLSASEKSITADDILRKISYPDSTDDAPLETDEEWDFSSEEITEDNEDLSFNERFERLLTEKDFEFARELLDFARYNEINDERYHCERLHLFEKMKDEDGFYEYYYEIESQIPSFPQNLQTQISKLVVQLAQRTIV